MNQPEKHSTQKSLTALISTPIWIEFFASVLLALAAVLFVAQWGFGVSFGHFSLHWVNFLAYVGLVLAFVAHPLRRFMAVRAESVRFQIEKAANDLETAEADYAQIRKRSNQMEQEGTSLREAVRQDGITVASEIKETAKSRAAAITRNAHDAAEAQQLTQTRLLKEEMINSLIHDVAEECRVRNSQETDGHLRTRVVSGADVLFH